MNRNKFFAASIGLLLAVAPAARSEDPPPEDSKGGKVVTNANSGPDQGGMQRTNPDEAPRAPAAAGKSDAKGGSQSPDDILEKMNADQGKGAPVDTERSPALLEKGQQFEAGRDIFENIFDQGNKEQGPIADGLPGMRIEEVNLQGVMTGAFGTVALFEGKDKEMYIARESQKFYNGRLAQIHSDKVVFEQEVIDEFGKKRPPIVKEVPLHTEAKPKVKKGRGQ